MYCSHCGKPNPDDSAFCSSCGEALVVVKEDRKSETELIMSPKEYQEYYRQAWRTFITKPFSLVLLICYSISVILNVIETGKVFSTMGSIVDILSMIPFLESFVTENSKLVLLLLQLCVIAPGALSAIGFWMLYADGWSRSGVPVKIGGFAWIRKAYIGAVVIECVFVLLGLFIYLLGMEELRGASGVIASELRNSFTSTMVATVVRAIVAIVIYRVFIKLAATIRLSVERCVPYIDYVKTAMIIEFVYGSLMLVAVIYSNITLGAVIMCAAPVLFGVWLLQYGYFLGEVHEEYLKTNHMNEMKPEAGAEKGRIPAWKRVEMEKTNDEG